MMRPDRVSYSVASVSASPRPMIIPPRNWLVAVRGFRMVPQSNDPSIRLTRTSPVTVLTRTSANMADVLWTACLNISIGGAPVAVTAMSSRLARDRIAAKLSCRSGSSMAASPARSNRTSPARNPASGLALPASRNSSPVSLDAAAMIAPAMDAVWADPPAMEEAGRSLSPIWNRTASGSSPRRSAACWTCTVAVPIPMSCAEQATVAVPSRDSVIRTADPGIRA